MIWVAVALGAIALAMAISRSDGPVSPHSRRAPPPPPEDLEALIADDPAQALARYGTPDDAARLAEQGVDLGALGYRPDR